MSTALYTRVSSQEQAQFGVSLEAQEARLLALYPGAQVYQDEGVSAGKPMSERPSGALLLQAVERGEVKTVVVASLSRAFRSASECLASVERWERMGVALVCLDLNIDTRTPIGKAFLTIASAFAELERNVIRQRTTDAMQHMKRTGKNFGNPRRWTGEERALAIEVVQSLVDNGFTYQQAADILNDDPDGIRPVRAAKWNVASIHQVLHSKGLETHRRTARP